MHALWFSDNVHFAYKRFWWIEVREIELTEATSRYITNEISLSMRSGKIFSIPTWLTSEKQFDDSDLMNIFVDWIWLLCLEKALTCSALSEQSTELAFLHDNFISWRRLKVEEFLNSDFLSEILDQARILSTKFRRA